MKNIILIEGIDRTGKDRLQKYLAKYFNYKYFFIVRSELSSIVYASAYNRYDYEYDNEMFHFTSDHLIIYLKVSTDRSYEIIQDRIDKTDHEQFDIKHHSKLYDFHVSAFPNVLSIEVSDLIDNFKLSSDLVEHKLSTLDQYKDNY